MRGTARVFEYGLDGGFCRGFRPGDTFVQERWKILSLVESLKLVRIPEAKNRFVFENFLGYMSRLIFVSNERPIVIYGTRALTWDGAENVYGGEKLISKSKFVGLWAADG